MAVEGIQSVQDPRVEAFYAVRDGELVRSRGLFVAEGRLVVRRVIEDRRLRVHSMLLTPTALADLAAPLAVVNPEVPVLIASAEDLTRIAGYDVHRGCLALVHRPPAAPVDDLVARAKLLVIVDGVGNADNVGGVFRNADAFGAGGVLLSPTSCDPLYRKAIRTSMGAALRVPFARAGDAEWPEVLVRVRRGGFTLVALTPHEPSETLDTFCQRPQTEKIALIVGAEGAGLTAAVESTADHRVRIPIADGVDSLNVAVATGIALYAIDSRQRVRHG